MRFTLLVILFFSPLRLTAHQVPIAFFNIDIEENTLHLTIQFDADDLDYAISSFYGELVNDTTTHHTSWISKYVNEHFSIALNQTNRPTDIQEIERKEVYYFITVASICLDTAIQSIKIHNECLIHDIDQHSNIIRINQTGAEERGFRLHEHRVSTTINL